MPYSLKARSQTHSDLPASIKAQFKYENRWIAYKKMRGQYSSAMEHAVPEQFWVDKTQCRYTDDQGQTQNPTKADCAQAVSAVKAIAIAQAEGQRIYTINQSNAATALAKLPVGGTVGQEIQSAIQAGKEVTFHERGINAHGFSGYGYIITDPETGAGAYMIEGRGNGGILLGLALGLVSGIAIIVAGPLLAAIVGAIGFVIGVYLAMYEDNKYNLNFSGARLIGLMAGIILSVIFGGYVAISFSIIFIGGAAWLLLTVARLLVIEVFT
ncbi:MULTISPECIES: hypothetical protein [unclassified Acidovorax]|uniref:hypothetical protein n=1 Tax=unclassified Acidovorax TaxID=2684926 RepID=UPI001C43E0E4|nr:MULTISPECIES: hypothetical protein [unclassified Acidovorax]MBV7429814.1 hypothetical protein [Acidovorax sp. sif0732]MBV7448892.1 hypothetical protein [Acidovorax sp. sif0715]